MREKIIFCHYGKAGGTWVNEYLSLMLRREGYAIRNSFYMGLGRDFTEDEVMLEAFRNNEDVHAKTAELICGFSNFPKILLSSSLHLNAF